MGIIFIKNYYNVSKIAKMCLKTDKKCAKNWNDMRAKLSKKMYGRVPFWENGKCGKMFGKGRTIFGMGG